MISKDGKRACVGWNSKNKAGGYDDWALAELRLKDGKWANVKRDGGTRKYMCDEDGFFASDAREKATSLALEELAALVAFGEAKGYKPGSVCMLIAPGYPEAAGDLAESIALQSPASMVEYHRETMEERREVLVSRRCWGGPSAPER